MANGDPEIRSKAVHMQVGGAQSLGRLRAARKRMMIRAASAAVLHYSGAGHAATAQLPGGLRAKQISTALEVRCARRVHLLCNAAFVRARAHLARCARRGKPIQA
jgi:hypothetical protein